MNERLKSFSRSAIEGLLALSLATLPPQPVHGYEPQDQGLVINTDSPNQNGNDPYEIEEDLRDSIIQKIYREHGIIVVSDYDPEITNALMQVSPKVFDKPNYAPTLEMVQAFDYVTSLIPSPGFLAQKIVVFPNSPALLSGSFLHNIDGQGVIALFHNPNIPLHSTYNGLLFEGNNFGSRMAVTLAHELGHGAHSNILYLQSSNSKQYMKDWGNYIINPEDPLLRTYAQVAGFEYIQPEVVCDEMITEEPCIALVDFQNTPFPLALFTRNLQGWVRTEQSLGEKQISLYAKWSFISEAFAEDFAGNLFMPEFYTPNQQRYYQNLFNGLANSPDPGSFLYLVSQNPEEILLDGINIR